MPFFFFFLLLNRIQKIEQTPWWKGSTSREANRKLFPFVIKVLQALTIGLGIIRSKKKSWRI